MTKTCYMCEKKATTDEHVPPKCIFPEKKDLPEGVDYRKNLITVPSCDEHNSQKSGDDEYLFFVLASAAQGNIDKQRHFDTKLMRAAKRRPHVFESFLKDMRPVPFLTVDGTVEQSAGVRVDVPRLESSIRHMACGIFFHHYQIKWFGGFRMYTNALCDMTSTNASEVNKTIEEVAERISRAFGAVTAHGKNRNIFSYKMYSEGQDRHAIFMTFYDEFEITVLLQKHV
jgi:hypothetical protein